MENKGNERADQASSRSVLIRKSVLGKNDELAEANRELFDANNLFVINMLSSPGSGKTALLERTLVEMADKLRIGVVVGDLQTDNDARRMRGKGAPVEQIVTGEVCHLEAEMVRRAVSKMDIGSLDVLIIENVGNLVCPASYDLGENARVALLSVTEGEDKPLKYPVIYKTADVVILSKMDIAEVVGFNLEAARQNISRTSPQSRIITLSSRTGVGMDEWYRYLEENVGKHTA